MNWPLQFWASCYSVLIINTSGHDPSRWYVLGDTSYHAHLGRYALQVFYVWKVIMIFYCICATYIHRFWWTKIKFIINISCHVYMFRFMWSSWWCSFATVLHHQWGAKCWMEKWNFCGVKTEEYIFALSDI